MKRVWTAAAAVPEPGGWGVRLDGKPLRLPGGPALLVPQQTLAEAVAAEWQAAGAETGEMSYEDVPLTRLAGTAQCRILPDPAPTVDAVAAYGATDLLCYRAERPPSLVLAQAEAWDPWLDWARRELGAALTVTTGVMHQAQHPAALAALHRAVVEEGPWALGGLGVLVPALGSLVLGLAIARQVLAPGEAFALSRVDEGHQERQWGQDAEAERRRVAIEADIAVAGRFMELVR